MVEESTDGPSENADVVGIRENANRNGVRSHPFNQSFPTEWKTRCLEVLRVYKENRRRRLNYKRLGWEHIRDLIMRDHDEYKDGVLYERDARLRRQDLEAWDNGSEPTGVKFAFIDSFIRKLAMEGEDEGALKSLMYERDLRHSKTLQEIYRPRAFDVSVMDRVCSEISDYLYSEPIEGKWHKSIIINLAAELGSVFKVVVAYLPVKVESLNEADFDKAVFYEGFLIPIHADKGSVTDNFRAKLLLTSPEYRGMEARGYADGEIVGHVGENEFLQCILDYPSTAHQPAFEPFSAIKKYPTADKITSDASKAQAVYGAMTGLDDMSLTLYNGRKYSTQFARLFESGYNGYVF